MFSLSVLLRICVSCNSETPEQASLNSGSSNGSAETDQTTVAHKTDSNEENHLRTTLEALAEENELFRWSLDLESTTGNLYQADPQDFKLPYSIDKANLGEQGWKEYATWIPKFYNGTLFATGWTANAKKRIGDLDSIAVNKHFNVLGRVIAAEWAKDNSIRKISTADLGDFSKMLAATALEDELLEDLRELAKRVSKGLKE